MQGQDSLLLLLTLIVAFRNVAANELRAGLLMGFGMFRFQVLLPILLLFLFWRAWKLVLGCLVTSCGMLAASIAVAGIRPQVQLFRLLHALAALPALELTNRMPNMRGLVTAVGGGVLVTTIVSAILLMATAMQHKKTIEERFLLATAVTCLVSYHFFVHDLCILVLPLVIALGQALGGDEEKNLCVLSVAFAFPTLVWFAHWQLYIMVFSTLAVFLPQMVHPEDWPPRRVEAALPVGYSRR